MEREYNILSSTWIVVLLSGVLYFPFSFLLFLIITVVQSLENKKRQIERDIQQPDNNINQSGCHKISKNQLGPDLKNIL